MPPRSLLGHLESLCLTLETMRKYVQANAETFARTASPGTMMKADRTISKIQMHMGNLDSELNAVAFDIIRRLRPD